ncbi:MAG: HAMP domain-containing histidine kinase [Lysobacter sp.]|nr:HAMP domain-containing histidine kinase [Lysobacter sp.]
MSQGLPRKIKTAFILQAVIASFAIVIGVYVASTVAQETLTRQRMYAEASSFWEARRVNPAHPAPTSAAVAGVFVPAGALGSLQPAQVASLPEGIFKLPDNTRKMLVAVQPEGRLYLTMSFPLVDRVVFWVGLASIMLALLTLYAVTWLTYRTSRRMVYPVSWLAARVSRWDPQDADKATLSPEKLPEEAGSEVEDLSTALTELSKRLREFVQRERNFTRDASHELRTPLTIIRVATDLMLDDPELPARSMRSLQRIQRAGRDMEAVIDAFLILAREADVEPLSETFKVHDVVYDEIVRIKPLCGDKSLQLDVIDEASPELHAPPRVLAVMIGNLLSNACTYTNTGRLEVRIAADRIVVRDTGIGMNSDELKQAFVPFYRADQANPVGKGIGLSIVRRLGERFGWPVTLESTPGEGTTATIVFKQ